MTDMLRLLTEHGTSDRVGSAASSLRHRSVPELDLRSTVDRAVIPRLRQALQAALDRPAHPLLAEARIGSLDEEIAAVADALLSDDFDHARARVDALRARGGTLELLYLKLLAPVALHISRLLDEDIRGLAETTIGFCNLQRLLRHYASEFYGEKDSADTGLRALLVAPSGGGDAGLSVFGLLLMSEFFRREGWDAWMERSLATGAFRATVLNEWFDLVEVLATSDRDLDEIADAIRTIRRTSPNPSVGVIACGPVFNAHPEFVRLVGADLLASDPLTSLSQARHFVTRTTQRRRLS